MQSYVCIVCLFWYVCASTHMQESPTEEEANDSVFVWI